MQNNQINQPQTGHGREHDGQNGADQDQFIFLFLGVNLRQTDTADDYAEGQQEEGGDDETVEFEVIFGADAVVEPFAVVVEELDASSAFLAVEAVVV